MRNPLLLIEWIEKNQIVDNLINQEDTITSHPMDQGYEAEVMKIITDNESYVLKVWSKSSKPDINFQFLLLKALFERGYSVSEPLGWGVNPNQDKVLLTSFDGTPIRKMEEKKLTELARILSRIHQIPLEEIANLQLPKYDFVDYFYPGIREHHDLQEALNYLVGITPINQVRLIHGDFHLGNILEKNENYTVIDWTNAQIGDSRYDFAWALILQKIYISERYASMFCSAYLLANPLDQKDLEIFEAISCLRWILLNKSGGVPKRSNSIDRVKSLIKNNPYLKEFEFNEIR